MNEKEPFDHFFGDGSFKGSRHILFYSRRILNLVVINSHILNFLILNKNEYKITV